MTQIPRPTRRSPRSIALLDHQGLFIAIFLIPAVIVTFAVVIYPLLSAAWTSLHQVDLTKPGRPFVGLSNYLTTFTDRNFLRAARQTAYFTVVSTTAELILGLAVALLVNRDFRGRGLLRGLLIIPWAIPTLVNGLMWRWIYHPQFGSLNAALTQLGAIDSYVNWLGTPKMAMNMVIVADVWKMTPLVAIILLANLQTIPNELVEAAGIDGAGAWRRLLHITFPLIRPGILIVMVLRTMEAFKVFDIIYIMTRGGPANGTRTVAFHAYTEAFTSLQFGRGAAVSFIVAGVIAVFAVVYFRILGGAEETV